jgi:cyanophycinase
MRQTRLRKMTCLAVLSVLVMAFLYYSAALADAPVHRKGGHLLVIGGALRSENGPVFEKFVELAGGKEEARIGIFPTASSGLGSSNRMKADLERYGVPVDQVEIIDITFRNAKTQAYNPLVVKQIENCTGLYFVGGDPLRVTQAFIRQDGKDTPALEAVRRVLDRGGVIAGSSAGAAIQSDWMISAIGDPMDALDFGLASGPDRRGVHVSKGLGFFKAGIIDQHFNTYHGRHARLARVLVEKKVPLGFGVDENTAMWVKPEGEIEVLGEGAVTIMDASKASLRDGPLGVSISNIRLNLLMHGDKFRWKTGTYTFHPSKERIAEGEEFENGNRIITDLSQTDAFNRAITYGLVDNTEKRQIGLLLRYNGHAGYGYRFTFSETNNETEGYYGNVSGVDAYAVRNVRMDVDPVTLNLHPSTEAVPTDLQLSKEKTAVQAMAFRAILPTDEQRLFHPERPLTRGEAANMIAFGIQLKQDPHHAAKLIDIPPEHPLFGDIRAVVSRGVMEASDGLFRPEAPVTREEFAVMMKQIYDIYYSTDLQGEPTALKDEENISPDRRDAVHAVLAAGMMNADNGRFRPHSPVTREEAALAMYKLLGFKWE